MARKALKLSKVSGLVLCATLAGCTAPGTYFNRVQVAAPVKVGTKNYKTTVNHINASLYVDTTYGGKDNKWYGLWYGKNYHYIVGPTDVLNVLVWGHPELSTPLSFTRTSVAAEIAGISLAAANAGNDYRAGILVDNRGDIFYPYVGVVHVAGLTVDQIRKVLVRKLIAAHYINPQVSVRVQNFRSKLVTVVGAVTDPGRVPITDKRLTILDAIQAAGGSELDAANMGEVYLVRGSGLHPAVYLLNAKSPSDVLISEKFKLLPGDIIYVPPAAIRNLDKYVTPLDTSMSFINQLDTRLYNKS